MHEYFILCNFFLLNDFLFLNCLLHNFFDNFFNNFLFFLLLFNFLFRFKFKRIIFGLIVFRLKFLFYNFFRFSILERNFWWFRFLENFILFFLRVNFNLLQSFGSLEFRHPWWIWIYSWRRFLFFYFFNFDLDFYFFLFWLNLFFLFWSSSFFIIFQDFRCCSNVFFQYLSKSFGEYRIIFEYPFGNLMVFFYFVGILFIANWLQKMRSKINNFFEIRRCLHYLQVYIVEKNIINKLKSKQIFYLKVILQIVNKNVKN